MQRLQFSLLTFFSLFLCLFNPPLFSNEIDPIPTIEHPHSKQKKVRFIINPKSGTRDKKYLEELIEEHLNRSTFDFEICYTKGPNHATALSQEAAEMGYGLVVAVGGDGTVNEVGKGIIGRNTVMGIIPSGSGNGMANHLKIPSDPTKAIQVINAFQWTPIDTIQINDTYFLNIAGIGVDADIAWKFAQSKKRGLWSYFLISLQSCFSYQPKAFEMVIDGKAVTKKGLLVSFANSSQYGNHITIAPQAQLDDGYLHIVTLNQPPFYAIPRIIVDLLRSNITAHPKYYESICCKEVIIRQKGIPAHLDGEPVYFENGMRLKVLPSSLKMLIPSKGQTP